MNSNREFLFSARIKKYSSSFSIFIVRSSRVGMFFKVNSLTPLQLKPVRQVLNPVFIHFSGAASGISGMSNSKVMLGLLLSIVIWNNLIVLILIGLVNTLLNKVLPSNSFQVFIFFLEGVVFFGAGNFPVPSVIEGPKI
ncbi:hypothetical protein EMIT051CA3_40538 [Pseudomonas chlororaphis]